MVTWLVLCNSALIWLRRWAMIVDSESMLSRTCGTSAGVPRNWSDNAVIESAMLFASTAPNVVVASCRADSKS